MNLPAAAIQSPQNQMSLLRWLAHEAVRANPLYVFSAALLAYAVQQLIVELDPQVGMLGGVLAIFALLQAYEIAVLFVATVVLTRRTRGGLDMHGLLIVAALYLGVTFIALDELVAIRPRLGLVLIPATLLFAAVKLAWYARLPGVCLPHRYRTAALIVLGAHALSPLLNSRDLLPMLSPVTAQNIAWLAGWTSLLPLLFLIRDECLAHESERAQTSPAPNAPMDPLATRWCGAWALSVITLTGVAHLFVSDWIADRPFELSRFYPAAVMLAAAFVLVRWHFKRTLNVFEIVLIVAPQWRLQEFFGPYFGASESWQIQSILNPAIQFWAATLILYIALARGTGKRYFYAGLAGTFGVPACNGMWTVRDTIPHFRAIVSACFGFAALGSGMVVSIYRERWLGMLKQQPAQANINNTSSPTLP